MPSWQFSAFFFSPISLKLYLPFSSHDDSFLNELLFPLINFLNSTFPHQRCTAFPTPLENIPVLILTKHPNSVLVVWQYRADRLRTNPAPGFTSTKNASLTHLYLTSHTSPKSPSDM